jgi:hypothetical protein
MKKTLFLALVYVFCLSCQDKEKKDAEVGIQEDSINQLFDEPDTEVDKDQNGCLNTAGYTWSSVKNECVKVFSIGLRLDPISNPKNEDAQKALYMIFSDDAQKVEIYLPFEQKPMILDRIKDTNRWIFNENQLVLEEDLYSFSAQGIVSFSGLGQIGPRVTGSDKIED